MALLLFNLECVLWAGSVPWDVPTAEWQWRVLECPHFCMGVNRASRNQCSVPCLGTQITCVGTWPVPPPARLYPVPEKGGSAVCGSWGSTEPLCALLALQGPWPACVPSREQLSREGNAAKNCCTPLSTCGAASSRTLPERFQLFFLKKTPKNRSVFILLNCSW